MIKSFEHKGLESFFLTGSKKGIQAAHAKKLDRQLITLNSATHPQQMDLPGWHFHPLKNFRKGKDTWAVSLNGNWRLIFSFDGQDAELVDYLDYH